MAQAKATKDCVLCFDFGAGSGRLLAVLLENGRVSCQELHRFANEPRSNGDLFWQSNYWLSQMREGLKRAFCHSEWNILSIGVDTWGVDMAYFDDEGRLLQEPYCYRSARTLPWIDEVHSKVPLAELYAIGGNGYFPFNSIYQLYCDIHKNVQAGKRLASFLFTPDFLLHLLADKRGGQHGKKGTAEYCIASTSGLCSAQKRDWDWPLIEKLGLPKSIFPTIVEAPYFAGELDASLLPSGLSDGSSMGTSVPLVKVASHDSAAAAASIELGERACFLICGTWFILGLEAPSPFLNEAAFAANIVHEGGALGLHRVQKLFCGFWLLQQLLKEWNGHAEKALLVYADLGRLAGQSALTELPEFDADAASLVLPDSMEQALFALLGRAYQRADLLRIVYHNMLLACKRHLATLRRVSGRAIDTICAVGGGVRDSYFMSQLEQLDGVTVRMGAVEASALGNAGLQFLAHRRVASLEEYKKLLASSL